MRGIRKRHRGLAGTEIFVQIPAYRDRELAATLHDLYSKAAKPGRLRVSVLWQHSPAETLPPHVRNLPGLDLVQVPFQRSRGCNWARSQVQKRWKGEYYTLFIDSHHRFVQDWDESLIDMHSDLRGRGIRRPVLTAYMPRYDPVTDPAGRQNRPYRVYPKGYEAGVLIHLTSYPIPKWNELKAPVVAQFASGHFIFAAGEFNRDVRMDPELYFTGDEVAISVRAYTNGYELFHPHRVIGWHCYDRMSRVTHWDDHATWWQHHDRSLRRLRRLFSGKLPGPYGLGVRRSIESFEDRLLMPLIQGN